ncbi:MAG: hypothetical protein KatS3mg115_2342 [Candidatus Poribacteria bacterium]|nr:MAG: hypothetical protein KatS3mg115_2342 [Candidatus Poribacteria bacterium]
MGDHGIAVLVAREGLTFGTSLAEADLKSDTAPVTPLVRAALEAGGEGVRFFRDPTRGGVATVLKELALQTGLNFWIDEAEIPMNPAVAAACEMLGFDPLYIANEGKVLAVVAPEVAEAVLEAWRGLPLGRQAAQIGEVRPEPAGEVHCATQIGGTRIVDMLAGEQLPRIC